jgi:hypothetical protein
VTHRPMPRSRCRGDAQARQTRTACANSWRSARWRRRQWTASFCTSARRAILSSLQTGGLCARCRPGTLGPILRTSEPARHTGLPGTTWPLSNTSSWRAAGLSPPPARSQTTTTPRPRAGHARLAARASANARTYKCPAVGGKQPDQLWPRASLHS